MQEPRWISKAATVAIHERQLAEHGGLSGIRDEGMLESALARPQNLFLYGDGQMDLSAMAAAYAYGIASNHPFIDGNKRTALVVALTFLYRHGIELTASMEERYLTILKLAAGDLSEEELAAWFHKNTKTS